MMLPWLEAPLDRLRAVHAQGRLGHALLIRGPEGWAETQLADRLALTLLGREEVDGAATLAHPDLKWIVPEGSMIKVEQIRELAGFSVGTRQSAPCKVAVLVSAELMNANAGNALLKTLEEPPPDTYLILTSTRPSRLLPTVLSRCQAVSIEPDAAAARRWLLEQWPEEAVEGKWFECGQAPMAVHQSLASGEPPLGPVLSDLAGGTPASRAAAELLAWDVDRLTSGWYRHCIALMAGAGRLPGLRSAPERPLAAFSEELLAVRRQLLTTNSANQRLLYERLISRWRGVLAAH